MTQAPDSPTYLLRVVQFWLKVLAGLALVTVVLSAITNLLDTPAAVAWVANLLGHGAFWSQVWKRWNALAAERWAREQQHWNQGGVSLVRQANTEPS